MRSFRRSKLSSSSSSPSSGVSSRSRREFIGIAAATGGIAALFPGLSALAQNGNNPRRIDVHHHFVPSEYVAYAKAHNQSPGLLMKGRTTDPHAANPWELSIDLEDMDKNGTAVSMLSVPRRASGSASP